MKLNKRTWCAYKDTGGVGWVLERCSRFGLTFEIEQFYSIQDKINMDVSIPQTGP